MPPRLLCAFLSLFLLAAGIKAQAQTAGGDPGEWRHGATLFGELKYADRFDHYDHANPQAPKGGIFHQVASGGFDSFNPFIVRGRAAPGLTESKNGLPPR